MGDAGTHSVTRLLQQAAEGDASASERAFSVVYEELRALAGSYFRNQPAGHTLQPTALVHEAFLRMVQADELRTNDREHFFALAARVMRQVLVDHARGRQREKRSGAWTRIALDDGLVQAPENTVDMLVLDEAMTRLADRDERMSRLVELRFFCGLTCEQAAEILGISRATADRTWRFARAWLTNELGEGPPA